MNDVLAAWRDRIKEAASARTPLRLVGGGTKDFYGQELVGERFGRGGDFLCGPFTAVDAFFCPVAFRFQTYAVALDDVAGAYCHGLLALPAMREWAADAATEPEPQGVQPISAGATPRPKAP